MSFPIRKYDIDFITIRGYIDEANPLNAKEVYCKNHEMEAISADSEL